MPQIIIDATPEYEGEYGPWGGLERLEFDCYDPNPLGTTRQKWQTNGHIIWAPYTVEVQRIENEIHIRYTEENNLYLFEEPYQCEDGDIIWGTHVLHNVVPEARHGLSTWNDQSGPGWKIRRPDGGRTNRRRSTVLAIQRGLQGTFRQELLALDGRCAVSGETCHDVLDAAHIVPAHRGGEEIIENGILLRADLHRLYDADPPRFEISPQTGEVIAAGGFEYNGFALNGIFIDDAILQRVSEALDLRQQIMG